MMINKLILGTVQFGLDYGINNSNGKPVADDVFKILDYAYDSGIRTLDTADAYGTAIDVISSYHDSSSNRFQIISKFKYTSGTDFETSLLNTLAKLKIDQLHGYMFHAFEDVIDHAELVKKIVTIKEQGLIKHIGVSVYTNEQLNYVIEHKEFDLIQLPYNLLDNQSQRGSYLKKAHELNKTVHVRSVFLQGLFFKELSSIHPESVLYPLKKDLENVHQIARDSGVSITALALQYALANNNIDGVLIGVETLGQLRNNINELSTQVPENIFKQIDEIKVKAQQLLLPINWK